MRTTLLGHLVEQLYPILPVRNRLLRFVTRLEGGQMRSRTLRRILEDYYGVRAGPYSYGSLLEPGMADRYTTIGNYVSVGPNVRRFGASHPMDAPSMHPFWYNSSLGIVPEQLDVPRGSLVIGHDAWIGANTTILPGCHYIGIGAVVGAASVVTKDVDDFSIVAGNPARTIGTRLSQETRELLLSSDIWQLPPKQAQEVLERFHIRSVE